MQDLEAGLVLQQYQIQNKDYSNCFTGLRYCLNFYHVTYMQYALCLSVYASIKVFRHGSHSFICILHHACLCFHQVSSCG